MPTALTAAPANSRPAEMNIAIWNASVDAAWAARFTAGGTLPVGWFKGATLARKLDDDVSIPGTREAIPW